MRLMELINNTKDKISDQVAVEGGTEYHHLKNHTPYATGNEHVNNNEKAPFTPGINMRPKRSDGKRSALRLRSRHVGTR